MYLGSHIMLWRFVGGKSICRTCCDLRQESGKDLLQVLLIIKANKQATKKKPSMFVSPPPLDVSLSARRDSKRPAEDTSTLPSLRHRMSNCLLNYWCSAPFRKRSGEAHDKGVQLYGSIFSCLAALRCSPVNVQVDKLTSCHALGHPHSSAHICIWRLCASSSPLVSVSVDSLTGNPAVSNVPWGSWLWPIRF